eukprot:tig00000404_g403.t1
MAHVATAALVREYAALTWQLFDSVAAHASAANSNAHVQQPLPHQIMALIVEKDRQVAKAIRETQEHLVFQQRIESVKDEIKQKETVLLNLADKLRTMEQSIEGFLRSSQSVLPARQEPLDPDDIIAYARKLSYTTSAPLGFKPDQPLRTFRPPAPHEGMMRASILYRELRPESEQPAVPQGPTPNAPYRPFLPAAQSTAAPQLFPTEPQAPTIPGPPPGWSATDNLLFNIPPPPPDWKPGDPIAISQPLPTSDAHAASHTAMDVDLLGSDDDDDD